MLITVSEWWGKIDWPTAVTSAVGAAIAVTAGAWLKGYASAAGKRAATKEDINEVIEKLKAVTTTAAEIKAEVGDKAYRRKSIFDLKEEAYRQILLYLEELSTYYDDRKRAAGNHAKDQEFIDRGAKLHAQMRKGLANAQLAGANAVLAEWAQCIEEIRDVLDRDLTSEQVISMTIARFEPAKERIIKIAQQDLAAGLSAAPTVK